jgi:hypothetical protein
MSTKDREIDKDSRLIDTWIKMFDYADKNNGSIVIHYFDDDGNVLKEHYFNAGDSRNSFISSINKDYKS